MKTESEQVKSKRVNISELTKDRANPIIKAFNLKGQVFGFAAYFIVADALKLTPQNFEGTDLLVDDEGRTYKVTTTTDLFPAYTKGYGRDKSDLLNIKNFLIMQSDFIVLLEPPVDGYSVLTVFKTTKLVLTGKGKLK